MAPASDSHVGALSPLGADPNGGAPQMAPVPLSGHGVLPSGGISLFDANLADPFGNGDFSVPLGDPAARWEVVGQVAPADGAVRILEDAARISGLFQSFALPAEATGLRFTLRDIDLNDVAGFPPDAFEVALFDRTGFASLLGPIPTLPGTDAILNIQADGTIHAAPGVGFVQDGTDLIVTVDLGGLGVRPEAVTLAFDLIGFGRIDSGVSVAAVQLLGLDAANRPPLAADATLALDEGSSAEVDLLAGAFDPDGDPLSVRIVTPPASGTLEPIGGGLFRFTPAEGFVGDLTASFTVFDGALESAPATLSITVALVNQPPVLAPVDDLRIPADTPVDIQLEATDREGDPLIFALVAGPDGASVDAETGRLTWAGQAAPGPVAFTVSVSDAEFTVETSFTVTVTAAPVLAPIAPVGVRVGMPVSIGFAATDADTDAADLAFALTAPDWLVLERDPGAATGRITGDSTGQEGFTGPITLTVTDPDGQSDSVTFTLSVLDALPPVLDPAPPVVLRPGEAVALTLTATDPDGDDAALRFAFTGPRPDWLAIDAVTGTVTGTPPAGLFGTVAATVQVTDADGLTATQPLDITLLAAPVLSLPAVPVLPAGQPLDITVTATDPDGPDAALSFALIDPPAWAVLDAQTGRLTGTPPADLLGAQTLRVQVTDPDGLTDAGDLTLTLAAAPMLDPIADQRLPEGTALDLAFAASDVDTDAADLTFILTGPDWLVLERTPGTATGRLTGDTTGRVAPAQTVTLTVTDPDGLSATTSFTVTVLAAPVLAPIPDRTITEGTALDIAFAATDADTDAADLTFTLTGPDWLVLERDPGAATGRITGDSTDREGPAQTVTLTVTDPDGLSASVSFALTVLERDRLPPELTLPAETRLAPGVPLAVTATATDPDGPDAALRFALIAAPDWLAIDAVTGAITGTPPADLFGRLSLTVEVTDADGLTATDSFDVVVLAAPILTLPPEPILIAGAPLDVIVTATDPDGDDADLRFSLTTTADWITLDALTGRLTGDSLDAAGLYVLDIGVTDPDGLTATGRLEVTVRTPPRFDSIRDLLIRQGTQITVVPQVSDRDTPAELLRFAMVAGPDWLTLDPATGVLTGDSAGQTGRADVTLRVTDPDGLSDTVSFAIDIRPPAPPAPRPDDRPILIERPEVPAPRAPTVSAPIRIEPIPAGAAPPSLSTQPTADPFCLSPRALRFGALQPGEVDPASLARLPMLFESRGGVREIVIEVSWLTAAMELLGVDLGAAVPADATLASSRSELGDRSTLRLTLSSRSGLPAGVLELLTLAVRSELLVSGGLQAAELRLSVVSINGADVCGPLPGLLGAASELLPPVPMQLAEAELEATEAAIDLALDLFGAAIRHPGPIDPAALPDGLLPLRIAGFDGAAALTLRLAWDASALSLAGASPGAGGGTLRLVHLAEGEAELHIADTAAPAGGAAVLASLALLGAAAGRRRGGLVRVTALSLDGVELILDDSPDTATPAGWTEAQAPAYPQSQPLRWSTLPG